MKTTAIVEDFSGIGNLSLVAALDIFHALNLTTAALPATVLSSQSEGFGKPAMMNSDALHQFQQQSFRHWQQISDMDLENIVTGYLGTPSTVKSITQWLAHCSPRSIIVDPVMADQGRLYPGIAAEMPAQLRKMINYASIISPNLTELYLLAGKPTAIMATSNTEIYACIQELRSSGYGGDVIVTGISGAHNQVISQYWSGQAATPAEESRTSRLPGHFYGTGDVFTATFAALLLKSNKPIYSFLRANQLVQIAVRETAKLSESDRKYGLLLYNLLKELIIHEG